MRVRIDKTKKQGKLALELPRNPIDAAVALMPPALKAKLDEPAVKRAREHAEEMRGGVSDAVHRTVLVRTWAPILASPLKTPMLFVMFNPSTADDKLDDPTIRRCIGFAKRHGCPGIIVVNLFTARATDPNAVKAMEERNAPSADAILRHSFGLPVSHVVAAWGGCPGWAKPRMLDVANMGLDGGAKWWCFGITEDGDPRHPLYLPGDAELHPWDFRYMLARA